MVCHSTAFVETVLAEKPYFNQISSYLKEQLNSLDCNEFDRVLRAIDQSEGLAPKDTTVDRGAFSDTLEGYHHLHWLAADWAAGNLSILLTGKPGLSLDDSISLAADNYIDNASSTEAIGYSESLVGKFTKRLSGKATGNWVVYICTKAGRYYLAISPHLTRKSSDEFELKELLDCISKEIPPEYRQTIPPHWQTDCYGVPFRGEHYLEMAEMLKRLKRKAIISLNDHLDIRRCFSDFHIETTDIRYTVGGGKGSDAKEVLILSWDIQAEPAGLF